MKRKLEIANVETPVVKWMDDRRILHRKLNGEGSRGWPDRIIFLPNGHIFLIEFKRPGAKLDPLQVVRFEQLQKLGHELLTFDHAPTAIKWIEYRYKYANGERPDQC